MLPEDNFSIIIAQAVLEADNDEIQLAVLNDLTSESSSYGELKEKIDNAKLSGRKAGDFGMEIIGPIIIPVLIEAGKELWKLYIKKLGEKTADKLADSSVSGVKNLIHKIWHKEEKLVTVEDYEALLRKAADKQGLPTEETDKLATAIKEEKMKELV